MPHIAKQFYPEIQGLRAISILAVILFHFQSSLLPGGYIGVDIFFVISGFLITKLITGEIAKGTFSIVRFYKNRVIRLLPNLFLMIVASAVIAYFVLKPYDFFQYAKSLQFSAIYLTNMVFARQQGYFDMSRDVKPLLHTWSLSIEEQFYVVFPFLLILLYKLKTHRITLLIIIALASLWVKFNYMQQNLPIEGFFSFAGRVWEFVVGALIALLPATLKSKLTNNEPLSLLGIALLAASLFYLDESVQYSAILLVIPCLATALVIACASGTNTGYWLSRKTLVFLGAMSYSLYLWHWPLLVWFDNMDFGLSRLAQLFALLTLTAAVSYLAWRYVEEPFRRNRERYSGKRVVALLAGFAVFCVSVGGFVYANSGLEDRFPNWVAVKKNLEAFDFKAATGTEIVYPPACEIGDDPYAILHKCSFGDLNSNERFLVLGDSHTAAWYPAFQSAAERKHAQGVLVTLPGCPPLFGIHSYDGSKDICAQHFDRSIGALIETKKIKKVFLVAFWSMYTEGDPNNQPNHFISDVGTATHDSTTSKMVITRQLQNTIRRLNVNGIQIVIVHSVPILPKVIQNLPPDYFQPLEHIHKQNQFMHDFVDQQKEVRIMAIDPIKAFCDEATCLTRIGGNILYTDNNHISTAGAARVIELIESAL